MTKLGLIHYNWPGFSFDDFLRFAAENGGGWVELQLTDQWLDRNISWPLIGERSWRRSSQRA